MNRGERPRSREEAPGAAPRRRPSQPRPLLLAHLLPAAAGVVLSSTDRLAARSSGKRKEPTRKPELQSRRKTFRMHCSLCRVKVKLAEFTLPSFAITQKCNHERGLLSHLAASLMFTLPTCFTLSFLLFSLNWLE